MSGIGSWAAPVLAFVCAVVVAVALIVALELELELATSVMAACCKCQERNMVVTYQNTADVALQPVEVGRVALVESPAFLLVVRGR
jgi:hypothetical protein